MRRGNHARWLSGVSMGLLLGAGAVLAYAQEAPKAPKAAASKAVDPKALEFFESKVRPVLVQSCNACHSGDKPKGGLRLDTAEHFLKGGPSGPLVVPGHPEKSLLIDAISYTKEFMKMPPQGKMKPQAIADLTTWVQMGAPWPNSTTTAASGTPAASAEATFRQTGVITDELRRFWAFQPIADPAIPAVKNRAWVKSPIDAFILAKLEAKGLKPAPAADKRTLIRRVTFDLTGLPPTPKEVAEFLEDKSPDAFAKVIDRLLASPAYGERWGRHWLDVARYADSNGLDENTAFGNAWRYRDYVIDAFNKDKPYDQFIREQIAGDLLPPSPDPAVNQERLIATGFLCLGPKVLAEPDKQKMVMDIVDEQIDTTGRAILGLTLGCARCHNHKFDPIPTLDYYSLAGIFKSTRTMATLNTVARVLERPLADKESLAAQEAYNKQLQAKEDEVKRVTDKAHAEASTAVVSALPKYLLASVEAAVSPAGKVGAVDLQRPGAVVLEAEKFKRGDVQVNTDSFGKDIGIIESAGRSAAFTEYEVTLAADGEYEVALRYASAENRPVKISLDGKVLKADAASQPTGGFNAGNQSWISQTSVTTTGGKHLLRIDQAGSSLPHIDKIALIPTAAETPSAPLPGRPRTRKPADLATAYGLDAELVRKSASYLLAAQLRGNDRIWGPWLQLSALPEAGFEAGAAKLAADWQAKGASKNWHPAVAALFSGPAPKTLAEAAQRYETLFAGVNQAWTALVARSKKAPRGFDDADREALRQALYGPNSAFGLDKPERLFTAEQSAAVTRVDNELKTLQKMPAPPVSMAIAVEDAAEIGNVKVHLRGNTQTLGDEAPRRFLRVVSGENQAPLPPKESGRLELAQWLTGPSQPLTPRVMVNRIWEHHFDEGIVRSPDNFGKLGDRPTHPELLDWLAKRFVEKGWSIKAMHRLMLLSNSYQMSTAYDAKAALADPENRLLWRANRHRVEVEAIRDSMLAVAGNLDPKEGGTLLNTPNFGYVTNDQSGNGANYEAPRRSIYLPVIRNAVFDVFQVFDFVEPSILSGKRGTTTVAPQALFLMNGKFVLAQSKIFAQKLLSLPGADDAARIRAAYESAFGRPASPDEVAGALDYLKAYEGRLAAQPDPEKRRQMAWASYCQILFASNEFVYVN